MQLIAQTLSWVLNALAPPSCAACDAPTPGVFCAACGELAPADAHENEIDGLPLIVVGRYAPPLSIAIGRFKYQGRAELGARLAALLDEPLTAAPPTRGSLLVPVPLHPRRLAERGYNQAAVLASSLASRHGLASAPRLLARRRETPQQVGKSREERLANTQGAFVVRGLRGDEAAGPRRQSAAAAGTTRRSEASAGRHRAILVDDVVTTGATVRACAQALRQAGIEPAAVVALARANGD